MKLKLKELREERGLAQLEISKQIGIPYHNYNKYELGKIEPDISTIIKIADFYSISIDELLNRSSQAKSNQGLKLKALRVLNNLTQAEVARRIGVTQSTYNYYEKEKTQPDFNTLIKIADLYNVSLDYLLGRQFGNHIEKATLTTNQQKMLEFVLTHDDKMNEDALNVLYGFANSKIKKEKSNEN